MRVCKDTEVWNGRCVGSQPSGQRTDGLGQSKHGRVESACDMERNNSESVGAVVMGESWRAEVE